MQHITIGVSRTRDMQGLDVRLQTRGLLRAPGTTRLYVCTASFGDPIDLDLDLAVDLGQAAFDLARSRLSRPQLPF